MSDIEHLVELSQTDQELITSQRNLDEVENQIKSVRVPLDQVEQAFQEKTQLLEEVTLQHQTAEKKLGEEDIFITKMEAQVPQIRTQKEFNAGKKQLEEARKRRGIAENELLESEIKQEEYQTELSTLQEELNQKNEEFQTNITDLVKQKEALTHKLEHLNKRREELISQLASSLSTQYQKFRKRGIFPAICPVVNKACSGCNSVLQPQLVNEMITNPSKHRNCPFCFRIIYYLPETE